VEEEDLNFKNLSDLQDILFLLKISEKQEDKELGYKGEFGHKFNTNILRIALNMKEEKIA